MAFGIHSFYVFPRTHNLITDYSDYFVGCFLGDPFNDAAFSLKLKKIQEKLSTKFGMAYSSFWSPGIVKPYKPLTEEQRYQRAVTKASNFHKRKSLQIIQENTLFTNDFLYEEINRHFERLDVLKKRYNQAKTDQ